MGMNAAASPLKEQAMSAHNGNGEANHESTDLSINEVSAMFGKLSLEKRWHAAHEILRILLGDSPTEEYGVYSPEGVLYICLMSPGKRELLRMLEDPALAEQWHARALATTSAVELADWEPLGPELSDEEILHRLNTGERSYTTEEVLAHLGQLP